MYCFFNSSVVDWQHSRRRRDLFCKASECMNYFCLDIIEITYNLMYYFAFILFTTDILLSLTLRECTVSCPWICFGSEKYI